VFSGVAGALFMGRPGFTSDFLHVWYASRALIAGADPYLSPLPADLNPGQDPALYPLPAYLLVAPLAPFAAAVAGGIFIGLGSALAAWGVARTAIARAPLFLSAPFLLAVNLGQWSPWLVAGLLVPALSWIWVAKPNVGLAAWLARPSWRTAAAIAGVVLISLAVDPHWPARWLSNLGGREEKFIPVLRPGGFLLVVALAAWRRPEGRLLFFMSLMPQALYFYDQLLLWLIPRTLRQSLAFSLYSVAAFLVWLARVQPGDYPVKDAVPYAWSFYLVALGILLWNWWQDRRASVTTG
jgi:hypothetical protein